MRFIVRSLFYQGISKEELRSRELGGAPSFVLDAVLGRTKSVVAEGDVVRLFPHRVTLQQDEEAASAKIESAFAGAGLAVPSTTEVLARYGGGTGAGEIASPDSAQERAPGAYWRRTGISPIGVSEGAGTARRIQGAAVLGSAVQGVDGGFAQVCDPAAEFLDREKVTRRDGGRPGSTLAAVSSNLPAHWNAPSRGPRSRKFHRRATNRELAARAKGGWNGRPIAAVSGHLDVDGSRIEPETLGQGFQRALFATPNRGGENVSLFRRTVRDRIPARRQ